jgi:hypothetical protein
MTLSCQKVDPLLIMTGIRRRCCRCFRFHCCPPVVEKELLLQVLLVIATAAVALVIMPLKRFQKKNKGPDPGGCHR